MKFRFVALFLVLAVVAWTQTSTPNPQIPAEKPGVTTAAENHASCHSDGKDGAACCAKMKADAKDGMACCAHHEAADGKDAMSCCDHAAMKDGDHAMSCCGGKDAKSCMKEDKSAKASGATAGCCPNGDCCGKGKACCDSSKDTKTTAMACCSGGHCGMGGHSEMSHGEMSK